MQELMQAESMQAVHFQSREFPHACVQHDRESCSSWKVTSHLFFPAWKLNWKWYLRKKLCCWKVIVTFKRRREELKSVTLLWLSIWVFLFWQYSASSDRNGICWLGMKAGFFLKACPPGPSTLQLNARQATEFPYLLSMYRIHLDLWSPWKVTITKAGTEKMSFSFSFILQHDGSTLLVSHYRHSLGFWDVWKPLVEHLNFLPTITLHHLKVHLEIFNFTWQFHAALEFLLSAGFQVLLNCSVSS